MKKEFFAGITILLLLTAAVSNVVHLSHTVGDITDRIDQAAHAVDMGDYTYALQALIAAHAIWDDAQIHTHTLLRHGDVDAVMESFYEATAAAGQADYYTAKYAMETLRSRLNTILDMEMVTLHSVF